MPSDITVNFLTTQHKASIGITAAFPDVCKTPAPPAPSPIPIPYPNVGTSSMASIKVTKRVGDDKQKVVIKGASYSMTSGDEPGVASGPLHEDPDFGDEEELMSLAGGSNNSSGPASPQLEEVEGSTVGPFVGLPELPDDLADAIEALKLAVLRHKTSGWAETDASTIQKYLDAISILMRN